MANEHYSVTKSGWVGIVREVRKNGNIIVDSYNPRTEKMGGECFLVNSRHFDLYSRTNKNANQNEDDNMGLSAEEVERFSSDLSSILIV